MPYVERNKDKVIFAIYNRPQPGRAEEYLPDGNKEILAFLKEPDPVPSEVEKLRVEVDAVKAILVTKSVITEAEKESLTADTTISK